MKTLRFILVGCFCLTMSLWQVCAQNITLNGVEYSIDTLQQFIAGPGCEYWETRMVKTSDGSGRLDAYFLRVDTKNPYIHMQSVMAKDKLISNERPTAMMARKSTPTSIYVGGTNGTFYMTSGDIGCPTGPTVIDREFLYLGSKGRGVGAINTDGLGVFGTINCWQFSGKLNLPDTTISIKNINYATRGENQLILYNSYLTSTRTNDYGTEVIVKLQEGETWKTTGNVKLVVVDVIKDKGNTSIAKGQYVLSGHGTKAAELNKLQIGDEVSIDFTFKVNDVAQDLQHCVGADWYAQIVTDGEIVTEGFWNEWHPRTGFGADKVGNVFLFCVVDGRGDSQGCTTKVLGEIMKYNGVWNAVNWDGGGSSTMAINHFGQMNVPSDGSERAVCDGFFAVADVPEDDQTIATLRPYETTMLLPHYGYYAPKFLGYNKYDVLINNDVQGVQLSCDASLGEILTDGGLLASGGVNGLLHATLGGVSTDINIRFEVGSQVSFRFDSVLVDNFKPYTVEVQSLVDGNLITLPAHVLTWTVEDESICTVSPEGVITGVANGVTTVAGQLGAFADTLTVYVQIPTVRNLLWDDFRTPENWKVKGASGYSPKLVVPDAATEPVDLQFTYKANRNPYVQLSRETAFYGLPDSVSIAYTTDALIDNVQFFIQLNNATAATNRTFTDLPTSGKVSLSCSFGDWVDATDRNCWPVKMRYVKFNFNPETPAGAHHIYLYGITLHYTSIDIVTQLGNAAGPSWHVYPNPVVDNMLQIQDITSGSQLVLTDLQGRQLIQQTLTDAHAELDMAAYPAGQYLLTIDNQTITIIKK